MVLKPFELVNVDICSTLHTLGGEVIVEYLTMSFIYAFWSGVLYSV